jgi:hypothetical protein
LIYQIFAQNHKIQKPREFLIEKPPAVFKFLFENFSYLTFSCKTVYDKYMSFRKYSIKIFLAILIVALMIPLTPPVSLAKAKLCCKTKCAKMGGMVKSGGSQTKHCHHQKSPIDCCKENCSQFVTYEKPDPVLAIQTYSSESLEQSPIVIWVAPITPILEKSKLSLRGLDEIKRSKPQNPPIYLFHSSFLI